MLKIITILLMSKIAFAGPLHLPLDLTLEESQTLYKKHLKDIESMPPIKNFYASEFNQYENDMETTIAGGQKLLAWIKLINSNRDGNPIRLTSKSTQRGIPINSPSRYSPKIVSERLQKILSEIPEEMKNIIYKNNDPTTTIVLSDEEFIKYGRKVSGVYQTATRWNMLKKWLPQLGMRAINDVRGFYYLTNLEDLDLKLINYKTLTESDQKKIKRALVGICINATQTMTGYCKSKVEKAITKSSLLTIKNEYLSKAQRVWDSYFKISRPRTDVQWTANGPNVLQIPFKKIKQGHIANWLKSNVEDEFRLQDENFSMELSFIRGGWGTSYLEFQPGVTPHVSGGNKIVMDANTDIQEYGVRWTIRHEFGHILRLPDCYTEFYDYNQKVMINYQLDTTDLMCSRAGQMNKRIYEELRRVYAK